MERVLLTGAVDLVTGATKALKSADVSLPNLTTGLKGLDLTPPGALVPSSRPITQITSGILETTPPPSRFAPADNVLPTTTAPVNAADGAIDVKSTEVLDETPFVPTAPRTPQPYSYTKADGAGRIPGTDSITPEGGISPNQLVDSSADGTAPRTPAPYRMVNPSAVDGNPDGLVPVADDVAGKATKWTDDVAKKVNDARKKLEATYGDLIKWRDTEWKKLAEKTGKSVKELKAHYLKQDEKTKAAIVGGAGIGIGTVLGAGGVGVATAATAEQQAIMAAFPYGF